MPVVAPVRSNGAPIPVSDIFDNGAFGYASVDSNGTPIQFWACDAGQPPAGPPSEVTGKNYHLH